MNENSEVQIYEKRRKAPSCSVFFCKNSLFFVRKGLFSHTVNRLDPSLGIVHQFAKRQMTYFRGMEERRGVTIHWIDATLPMQEKIASVVQESQKAQRPND